MGETGQRRDTILGFNRNIFFVGLVSLLTDTSTKMVYSIMPMFLMSIGASKTTLSVIEGIAESTAALVKTAAGFFSDRIGRNKPFMVVGYAITAIVTPIYAAVTSPVQVLALRFVERFGKGVRTAPRDSLVAGSATSGNLGRSFGLHKAMDNSGAIIGPLIAFGLIAALGENYRMIFILSAIPAVLGVLTIIGLIRDAKKPAESLYRKFRFRDFPKKFYLLLAIIFLFTLGNSTDALLIVKANEVGIKIAYIPLVYLIFNAVSVLLAIPIGSISDKVGRERILVFGYLVYAVVYLGFGYTTDVRVIVGLFATYGLYSACTDGIQKAFVSEMLDKNKQGTGLGIYNALLGITLLPASIIAGVLYDKVNNRVPFYFGAATAILAAVLMIVFAITNRRRPATTTD
ncbi:MAG TPA: MFS transporter [Myxococcota bacterium]|nr:MFS transporter [Myxococcota bacterium]HPV04159.1 MFS transporter [Myxococcota bacterium]